MEYRGSYYSAPIWEFEFPFTLMDNDDILIIGGFLNLLKGAFDTFYFRDPLNNVEDFALGTGDGSTTQFQLYRNWNYWFTEYPYFPPFTTGYGEGGSDYSGSGYGVPIWETPYIYLDGVLQYSDYSISQRGLVTFTTAPADGVVITADFYFYYRCRFKEDYIGLENFNYNLWRTDSIVLVSVK
jgi:hypothetical protein